MRVVVTGATGDIGTSVILGLVREPSVTEIVGLARQKPDLSLPKTEFVRFDLVQDDLVQAFRGADAVIHLAWRLASRATREREAPNVSVSRRVFEAVVRAHVGQLLVLSSVGSYAMGPKDRAVNEDWPTTGIPESRYSSQKAAVERLMDELEWERPEIKLVRMRPGLVLERRVSSKLKRLFIGGRSARALFRRSLMPVVIGSRELRFQALHSSDVGEAFRLALISSAKGPFNLAAEPVLDAPTLGRALGKPVINVPSAVLRALAELAYRLRLVPSDLGWLELMLKVPLVSAERARHELGWSPTHGALSALMELGSGLSEGAAAPNARLASASHEWPRLQH